MNLKSRLLLFGTGSLLLWGFSACQDIDDQIQESKQKWYVFNMENGLPSDTILSLAQDENGSIWIGAQNGLYKLASSTSTLFELKSSDFRVNSISCSNGYVMLSTSKGAYVIYNDLWYYVNEVKRNCLDMEYFNDAIWCLYDDGGLYVNQDSVSKFSGTNELYTKESSFWLCRLGGLYRILQSSKKYNTSNGMSSNLCFTMYQDDDDTIWAGTFNENGLSKILSSGIVKNFKCGFISSIAEDNEGTMWFGSQYYGVYKMEKNGNITNFTTLDGIPNNRITDILVSIDGSIWISTKGGGIAKLEN